MRFKFFAAVLATGVSATALHAPTACAQTTQKSYNIDPQSLGQALQEYSRVSGRDVIAAATLVAGRRSGAVRGRLSDDAALSRLLAGTGLHVELVDGAWVLQSGNDIAPAAPSTETDGAAIIVTGTRIRGTAPVGSPLNVIDREQIDRSGRGTLADFIQTLPQNFSGGPTEANIGFSNRGNASTNVGYGTGINLRGLGPGATLTLFDGVRPALGGASGAFADVSMVPSVAIERVEILTDGASAIYGSDAVAGVVNLRFRSRFEGVETRLRVGTADGDYGEVQLSQIFGKAWDGGHLTLAAEYNRRDSLASSQRAFATEDLRAFGGPDLRSNYNVPGTIVAANGARFLIPAGQDGTRLTAADLIPSLDFRRGDARRLADILPRQETVSGFASFEQTIGEKITVFARGLYSEREYSARRRINAPTPVTVTSSNPFYVDPIGTGRPVTVYYDASADFGAQRVSGKTRALNTAFGARGDIGAWRVEISGGYGRQRDHYTANNLVNRLRLSRALAATDRSQAINVFGDGAVNNPALIARLRGSLSAQIGYGSWNAALRADGSLFSLPAGPIKAAIGAEYRHDRLTFEQTLDLVGDTPTTSGIPGLPDRRIVKSTYGELVIPVFDAGDALPGTLTLSAAGRYEEYSDVGSTINPKLGLRWLPMRGISLRGSYGHSFRAPFFDELVGAANALYQTLNLADPKSPTGQTTVLALFGVRPDLSPEKAKNWTFGADIEPIALPGFRLSATYFNIRYRDRIASAASDSRNILLRRDLYSAITDETPDPAEVARYFADPNFANPLGAAPGAIGAIIDLRTRNLTTSTIRGIDLDLAYRVPVGNAAIDLSLGGTRLLGIDNQVTRDAPKVDVAGTLGNPVKLRLRGRVGLTAGTFDSGIAFNHVGSYRNLTVTPAERVKSWTTFDLQFGARFDTGGGRALRLALSINNVLDQAPPYAQFRGTNYALAYDPEQSSPIGRNFALQASVIW